jgi:hypothetical protein
MKNLFLFFGVFVPCIYFSQIKLNTRNDVEIFLMDSSISMEKYLNPKIPYQYKIVNHTNDVYIIDPQGFIGESKVYECNKLYSDPEKLIPQGYYSRDEEDCEPDLIVVKKQETKLVELYLLNIRYYYNLKPNKRYYLDVKSKHNKYSATLLGCNNYIDNLEKKGYKILDDNISFKILLTK